MLFFRCFLVVSPFLTLAPRDFATYCQARGLSGHTSPYGECVLFFLGHNQAPAAYSASFLLFFKFLTLAPHDYIICCQARGLSGHTSPRGECAGFFLEDCMPIEED